MISQVHSRRRLGLVSDDGLAGAWDDLVVMSSANPWDGVPRLHDVHMAQALSRLVPVLFVDPPISQLTARRNIDLARSIEPPHLRLVAPSLARLTPVVTPFKDRPCFSTVANLQMRRALREAIGVLGGSVRAAVSALPLHPMLDVCGERVRVYWAQDDLAGGHQLMGSSRYRLRFGESRLARQADVVVASSPVVAAAWEAKGRRTTLIPFGVDCAAYATADALSRPADVQLTGPTAGFIGSITDRIDFRLLEAVAERGCSLLLVGHRHPRSALVGFERLLAHPNVQWVGPKPFEALPPYLACIDVGLVPYVVDSAFNRSSFPLKTLEYLAGGRRVVATPLPATRWLATDLITMASEPAAFADAVDRALITPRAPAEMEARRALATEHSWSNRAADLVAALERAEN